MAKKNALTVATATALIGLSVQAGTQEVIDIKIAQLEADLDTQIAKLQGQAKAEEATKNKASKEMERLVTEFGNTKWKTAVDSAATALAAMGCGNCTGSVNSTFDLKRRIITCSPQVAYSGVATWVQTINGKTENYAFTDEMITQINTMEKATETLNDLYAQIAKAKQRLAMIPKYERKIRAVIGKTKLEESEEGRALLQKVMDINLLPEQQ